MSCLTAAYKNMTNVWDQIKHLLARQISGEAYRNWVEKTSFRLLEGDQLRILVPNDATREWMETEYTDRVRDIVRDLNLPIRCIHYEINGNNGGDHFLAGQPASEPIFQAPTSQLNPKFTFDSFVVGSCNQFAHAAAKAVASMPSRSYNPLFIYGGVGMGKTHLMHAIGRNLIENFGSMRIVYTTSERFMNQMITSIKVDRMPQFHQYYRSADVLLIDDIQIIGGKERTQEEFFHTFNELYDHQKQIVISSDQPPKSTSGLVERLRSRFEWGLMVDVQPPDLETKMAILDKKAEQEGIKLPEDVRIFIATRTKSNVRELEGALIKLIAYSSVTGTNINMAMAQQVLKSLGSGSERKITMDSIMRAVAEKFSLQPSQLKQKSNTRQIAYPRQVAMYLIKELTHASFPEIGRFFAGKHHTTVLHSVQKIEQLRTKDPELNRLIHSLMDALH
ncbi:MAG: chromosomal replication initiator protein DnaA [Acidobacteria bacterium]|nr:chromosomal replication initiator protein DnaA [Acidobacteriota bacterium]